MKKSKRLLLSVLFLSLGITAQAQDITDTIKKDSVQDTTRSKRSFSVSIGSGGVSIRKKGKSPEDSARRAKFTIQWGLVDLGFNRIDDKTNYGPGYTNDLSQFLGPELPPSNQVPATLTSPFKLNEGKSINVNVWIANTRLLLAGGEKQKLYFTSGIGLQMYNFRFDSRKMYASEPNTHMEFIPSNLDIQKNKLGFTYAAIPLGLLAKTRITEKRWLVYGASVTGGYRIASWTKLKTSQNGKEKNHDPFNFSDFNACVMAEIGIDNVFRLYGSYQLTPLSSGPLNQHPFAIGIRFFGL